MSRQEAGGRRQEEYLLPIKSPAARRRKVPVVKYVPVVCKVYKSVSL